MQTLQLKPNEPKNTKLYVCQRWDVRTWQFFRYLKVEKSLNPLCFTVSFRRRAAANEIRKYLLCCAARAALL